MWWVVRRPLFHIGVAALPPPSSSNRKTRRPSNQTEQVCVRAMSGSSSIYFACPPPSPNNNNSSRQCARHPAAAATHTHTHAHTQPPRRRRRRPALPRCHRRRRHLTSPTRTYFIPWHIDADAEIDTGIALQGDERRKPHCRIILSVNRHDHAATPAQQLIDTEIVDMPAVGEVDIVAVLIEPSSNLGP